MDKLLVLLSQRRVWSAIVSMAAFGFGALKVKYNFDIPVLTDLLTAFGGALAALVSAGLAVWSYFQPKPHA